MQLHLIQAPANPDGAENAELYLFVGNPTIAPVTEIVPAPGVTLPPPRDDLPSRTLRLKVLHLNDLHGHIARFSPQGDQPVLSRMVNRMRTVRRAYRQDPNTAVLTMSAGDDLVGAVFDELLGDDLDSFALHAGYRLYSAAGIDVAILGNHDLELGTDVLAQAILKDAEFPVLSANLVGCHWLEDLIYPAALLVTKGIRVGIIGLICPGEIQQLTDSNLHMVNPVRVIHNMLPAIRPLCDVLIILSHLGYSLASSAAAVRDAGDVELARSLPPGSVDLIVGGHTHNVLNEQGLTPENIVNNIPIVQAGTLGRFLGEVDITIQQGNAAATSVRLTHAANLPVDESFEETNVTPLMNVARPLFERSLGEVSDHPDLTTDAVRNALAAGESALTNFITDAMATCCQTHGYQVDLAILDASAVRRGLPAGGNLTFGAWFELMPFADVIRIVWLTGEQLYALLEDNAYRIDRPGEPHTERGFLHFSRQVRYTIEAGATRKESRVSQVMVNDIPLADQLTRSFQVACTSFLRLPAQSWEKFGRRSLGLSLMDVRQFTHLDTPIYLRDEMVAYIEAHGGVTEAGGARRDGRVQYMAYSTGL